ncbi:MAG: DinB family protein [Nocardioidaceae bacterium]|nr:DinB family protein [Nocardioidaceae bacterium]
MNDESHSDATLAGSEREQIEAFLHDNRTEILHLLDGLTEEQARRRLVPSRTTLLGLVKHAAFAERVWFDVALAGRTRAAMGLPEAVDESFVLTDEDTVESVAAQYRQAWADADEIAASFSLDDLAIHNRRGPLTLRWIYVHMIEELARHAGHGDILREQILAADDCPA